MLEAARVPFEAIPADIDERALEAELADHPPATIARRLSGAKAQAVSQPGEARLVLGSDSLVMVEGRRFDKPQSREQAEEHLRYFSNRVIELYSAAAIARQGEIVWDHTDVARLSVRKLSEQFIAHYLDAEWPEVSYCVGVFRIEAMGVQLFEKIEGDQFTVLGMPLLAVLAALREIGEIEA